MRASLYVPRIRNARSLHIALLYTFTILKYSAKRFPKAALPLHARPSCLQHHSPTPSQVVTLILWNNGWELAFICIVLQFPKNYSGWTLFHIVLVVNISFLLLPFSQILLLINLGFNSFWVPNPYFHGIFVFYYRKILHIFFILIEKNSTIPYATDSHRLNDYFSHVESYTTWDWCFHTGWDSEHQGSDRCRQQPLWAFLSLGSSGDPRLGWAEPGSLYTATCPLLALKNHHFVNLFLWGCSCESFLPADAFLAEVHLLYIFQP